MNYRNHMKKVMTAYGIESVWTNPNFKRHIGLEDLEEELEANNELYENGELDEAPDENTYNEPVPGDEWGETWNDDDNMGDENVPDDDSETPVEPDLDDEVANVNEDDREDTSESEISDNDITDNYVTPTWDGPETIDELKSNAQCLNMVSIVSEFTNTYVENMELFYKANLENIELTGDITKSKLYKFMADGVETCKVIFKDDENHLKTITNLWTLINDVPKMKAVCGNERTPFIYEGIQLLMLELVRSILALVPFHLRDNTSISEIISNMGLKVVSTLLEMAADIVEVSNLFSTRIFFIEPVDSEVTGKPEDLAGTPYAILPETQRKDSMSIMNFAGESIINLIQIKNNNALPEYSLITKMLGVISGIMRDVNLEKSCTELVEGLKVILLAEANEDTIEEYCDKFRTIILMPQIERFSQMVANEQKKLTE